MGAIEYVTAGAARTARWRAGLRQRGLPETDDIDTVLATAFASFVDRYFESRGHYGPFMTMVAEALRSAGYCTQEGSRRAEARLYYLHMLTSHPGASAAQRRRWELGRPPEDASFMDEEPDPEHHNDGYFDPTDEVVLEEDGND
ncbi:hypothetical protein [Rhizobium sp. AAP43]|uniref:hypothetical protein n=1 Tax=Rhizobium sp. AAP43 TaxID=1523420 RepID=UPI0006B94523|nr:hypothetical protein [Rhizobium sp. AAP43]KPF43007.1 hypothetical protein IP76_14510 [Rhizobium sp. AAP43]